MEDIPEVREVSRKGGGGLGVGEEYADPGIRLDGSVADVVGADDGSASVRRRGKRWIVLCRVRASCSASLRTVARRYSDFLQQLSSEV